MATFKLTINMDNAAFEERDDELECILAGLADALAEERLPYRSSGVVLDTNGNTVGAWEITED
jgi:hypothetical protein